MMNPIPVPFADKVAALYVVWEWQSGAWEKVAEIVANGTWTYRRYNTCA